MRNRRKNPRVRARGMAVHVSVGGKRHPCVVDNISIGGLFVRTDSLLEVGTEVRIDLVRPGWKKALQLDARIVTRTDATAANAAKKAPGMGVQFTGVRGEQRERLQKLLVELGLSPEAAAAGDESEAPTDELDPAAMIEAMRVPMPSGAGPQQSPAAPMDPLDPQPSLSL